ncbi:hypothetical protein MHYP_G00158900 [Metynnis hypsauchen]
MCCEIRRKENLLLYYGLKMRRWGIIAEYKESITIIPQFTVPNVQCRSCQPLYHVMALLQMKNSLDCRRKAHPSLRTLIGVGGRLETAGRCVFGDSKPRKMGEKEEGCQRAKQRGMNNAG